MVVKMAENIKKNLKKVYENIQVNAKKANRDPSSIKLVAVGKNHPPKKIISVMKAGHHIFGENRVQELLDKYELFYDQDIKWHFIGHLQKNKVKYLMKIKQLEMIESIDSIEIAKEVNQAAKQENKDIKVLLQVNIADDPNKFGFSKDNIKKAVKEIAKLDNIQLEGLMTITPYYDEPESARDDYKEMKNLINNLNKKGYKLNEISMGMSNDYHVAVQEGATIIRVGTAIFGKRKYY
ncbi:MAG TPA: YggS family pyridoxal phosphate-dependent enzyme [Halanaerobiales bacterium]|nr:YggS family pyridoxal phosphate-dependent enzyme [Halanaerobiales bacterium]